MTDQKNIADITYVTPSAVADAVRAKALDDAALEIIYAWSGIDDEGRSFEHTETLKSMTWASWLARSGTGYQLAQAKQKLSAVRPKTMQMLETVIAQIKQAVRDRESLKAEYLRSNPQYAEELRKAENERRRNLAFEKFGNMFTKEEIRESEEATERARLARLAPGVYVPKNAEADTGSRISVKNADTLDAAADLLD